jgi:tetratricopeptide (TPR) repeat protein
MMIGRATAITVLWLVVISAPQRGSGAGSNITDLLDAYDRGGHDAAIQSALGSGSDVRKAIEREAAAWIEKQSPASAPRRRIVVAAFVIDFARARYSAIQAKAGIGTFQSPRFYMHHGEVDRAWSELRPLVEWACALLRRHAAAPFEREWFIASLQLFRDFGDADVHPIPGSGLPNEYGQAPGHLGHALGRLPNEPWIRIMVAERQTNRLASSIRIRIELAERDYVKIEGLRLIQDAPRSAARDASVRYAYLADLRRARQDVLPLAADPSVRARVHLNLGGIALAFGERDVARRYFDDIAPWTSNPCLTYLGHLLRGRVEELENRPEDAERAYRAALTTVPQAQSGAVALSTLLWLQNRPGEASVLAESAFSGTSPADDPWTAWQNAGHCTEWHQVMTELRQGLRR